MVCSRVCLPGEYVLFMVCSRVCLPGEYVLFMVFSRVCLPGEYVLFMVCSRVYLLYSRPGGFMLFNVVWYSRSNMVGLVDGGPC
jgi:hypothetical protein